MLLKASLARNVASLAKCKSIRKHNANYNLFLYKYSVRIQSLIFSNLSFLHFVVSNFEILHFVIFRLHDKVSKYLTELIPKITEMLLDLEKSIIPIQQNKIIA